MFLRVGSRRALPEIRGATWCCFGQACLQTTIYFFLSFQLHKKKAFWREGSTNDTYRLCSHARCTQVNSWSWTKRAGVRAESQSLETIGARRWRDKGVPLEIHRQDQIRLARKRFRKKHGGVEFEELVLKRMWEMADKRPTPHCAKTGSRILYAAMLHASPLWRSMRSARSAHL